MLVTALYLLGRMSAFTLDGFRHVDKSRGTHNDERQTSVSQGFENTGKESDVQSLISASNFVRELCETAVRVGACQQQSGFCSTCAYVQGICRRIAAKVFSGCRLSKNIQQKRSGNASHFIQRSL